MPFATCCASVIRPSADRLAARMRSLNMAVGGFLVEDVGVERRQTETVGRALHGGLAVAEIAERDAAHRPRFRAVRTNLYSALKMCECCIIVAEEERLD